MRLVGPAGRRAGLNEIDGPVGEQLAWPVLTTDVLSGNRTVPNRMNAWCLPIVSAVIWTRGNSVCVTESETSLAYENARRPSR